MYVTHIICKILTEKKHKIIAYNRTSKTYVINFSLKIETCDIKLKS